LINPVHIVRHLGPRGLRAAISDWLLFVPPGPRRVRPEEVLYGLDERPPLGTLLGISAQHVLLALMLSLYAVIAARGIGLDAAGTAAYTSSCLFWLGIGTMLYGIRSRLTPGIPLVNIPSPISFATYISVASLYGPGAAVGAFVLANAAIFLLAGYLPRMRAYFPPEVTGVVVLMLGVSLIAEAVGASVGIEEGHAFSIAALAASLATLAGIIWASVWGGTRMRLMAVLIGALAGGAVAVAAGLLDAGEAARMGDLPLLALPLAGGQLGWPVLVPAAIVPVLLIEVLGATDQLATALTLDKLNDANWRRADMPMVSRAVKTLAIGNVLLAAMGLVTSGSSTANLGLAHASGVMSRQLSLVAGAMMIALAFFPAVSALIVLTPAPVVGGLLIYTSAFMIVAGMDLILSRMLNAKRSFTVGLSIVIGTSVYVLPQMVAGAPQWSQTIVSSGLTVAALVAIVLNMLFRIGVSQTAATLLHLPGAAAEVAEFLEHWGKAWGARREVILRAGVAIGEALEILDRSGAAPSRAELLVTFDEVRLVCTLRYEGEPLALQAGEVDASAMLDGDDDAFEAGMQSVSALMVTRLADRVRAARKGGTASLTLEFEH
jgi:xanthine/uracil permease